MSWHEVIFTGSELASGSLMDIVNQSVQLVLSRTPPSRGIGIFNTEPEFNMKERARGLCMSLYFSPEASEVFAEFIRDHDGHPCEKPDRRSVSLFAGYSDSLFLASGEPPP